VAALITNVGEEYLLAVGLNKQAAEDLELRLFTNDKAPAEGDVLGDYTEAVGFGYVAKTLLGGSWSMVLGAPTVASYVSQVFTFTGALGNVYGYYVVAPGAGVVVWANRFSNGPYAIVNNGDAVTVIPRLGAD
jgi:hypothetical protein